MGQVMQEALQQTLLQARAEAAARRQQMSSYLKELCESSVLRKIMRHRMEQQVWDRYGMVYSCWKQRPGGS